MTTINESTSVVAVKTKQLTVGQSTIVYVSSTSDVGQLVSVFDIQGYLSAPQSILVSTTDGIDFGPGISSFRIQQRFGFTTLRSESTSRWSIINENAFRTSANDYTIQGLQTTSLQASQMMIMSSLSTAKLLATGLATDNATLFGPLFVSSLGSIASTFLVNSLSNSGNYFTQSSISTTGRVSIGSTVTTAGPVTVQNNLTVGNGFTTQSTMYLQSSLYTTQRILVNSNITVQGLVTISSNVQCFTNASTVATVANQVSAKTFITNNIIFGGGGTLSASPSAALYISPSLYVPATIQTSTLTVENVSTQNLTVLSKIFTPAISIPNAAIQNTGGSLVISSIQANSIQYTSLYGSNATSTIGTISTQTALFSTLLIDGELYVSSTIDIAAVNATSLYADQIFVNSITSGASAGLNLDAISISTITISSAFNASQMSSFVAPSAIFKAAQIITGAAIVGGNVVASSLSGVDAINGTGILTISTGTLYTSSIAANIISTNIVTTSSLTLSNAVLGSILVADPTAPYFFPSTFSGLTSNTPSEYIKGSGAPFSPFHVVVSRDSDIAAYISSGTQGAYLTMKYSYNTTAPSTTGSASIILRNPIVHSTLVTISSTTVPGFQTYSLSNYPIDTKVFSSVYTYSLIGPMTYALPSSIQSQQTLVAGGSALNLAYSSDGGSKWITLPYVGFETATYGIAYGLSKWVAVGDGLVNTMIMSYTGTVWYDLGKTVFSGRGLGIAWNGSSWVALGEGTNTLATSADGITWTGYSTTVFSTRGWGAAAANTTTWVAVGEGTNTLASSTDGGKTWTGLGTAIFSVAAYGVAWNGVLWIAVGQGTNTLATSPDGLTWTGKGTTVFQTAGRAIAWNGSYWLACSATDPVTQIAYSVNGVIWTRVLCPLTSVYSIAWTGLGWVASGTGSPTPFATSPNGLAWTASTSGSGLFTTSYSIAPRVQSPFASSVAPLIITVGQGTYTLATSPDGLTWTPQTIPFTTSVNCVAWNGSLWVAGGIGGAYKLATSPDGINWTGITISNISNIFGIAWGRGKWIAVGIGGGGYTRAESTDGITWTPYPNTTGNFFSGSAFGIVWAQDLWIATGTPEGSGILFSLDGTNWIPQIASIFTIGSCVTSNGTVFLAGGQGPPYRMAYSLEGSVWEPITSCPFTTKVNGIAWGGGVWVGVGQGANTLAYSYDGFTWIGLGTSIFSVSGSSVAWTGSSWIATGSGANTLAFSYDGITWQGQGNLLSSTWKNVAANTYIQPNTYIQREEPIGIRWDISGVAILSPSVIEKPARTNPGYDSTAYSLDGYTANAFLQFRPGSTTGSVRIGLTTGSALAAISYAFSLTDTGNFEVWEYGYFVIGLGSFQISDTFQIIFDGTKISYQKNSVEVFSTLRGIGLPVFLGTQFNLGGTRLHNLEFHPINEITNSVNATSNQYFTTTAPSGLLNPTLTFTRPIVETVFPPSLWEFAIPMSGTVVTPSSMVYADVYISTNRLFSTAVLQTALTPTVSTFTLQYTLSTATTTNPGDTMSVNLYTQHSGGVVSLFSTTFTTSVYNLSSTQYVELVHNSSTLGAQTSDLSVWIQNVSTPMGRYVNSNCGIEMNLGLLRWNQRQYGITIQNQYNDLQTRSLTYTGALYTASDSNLKHDTAYADTGALYDAIGALPLHRYTLIGPYRDRFKTEDANQLGVLTTEVAAKFPSMIKVVDSEFVPDLQTVDRIQLRYAHLGATQHIIERLSTLQSKIMMSYRVVPIA